MINTDYVTLYDVNSLLKFIQENSKDINYSPFIMHCTISILTADIIRLGGHVKYVNYPPYGVFCTIREIIEKYNEYFEVLK